MVAMSPWQPKAVVPLKVSPAAHARLGRLMRPMVATNMMLVVEVLSLYAEEHPDEYQRIIESAARSMAQSQGKPVKGSLTGSRRKRKPGGASPSRGGASTGSNAAGITPAERP